MKRKGIMLGVLLSAGYLLWVMVQAPLPDAPVFIADAGGEALYHRLFDPMVYHELIIEMDQNEFNGMSEDMLAYQRLDDRMRTGNYRKATVTYKDEKGQVTLEEVGIRTKGNTTRVLPQEGEVLNLFHFKLKFDETFELEETNPLYQVKKKQSLSGLKSLNVKYHNYADASLIKETYAYNLLNQAGVMTSKAAMVHVKFIVAGESYDYGVFTMVEPIDEVFLERRLGPNGSKGDLYKCLWQNYGPATLEPLKDPKAVGTKIWQINERPAYDKQTNLDKDHDLLLTFIERLNMTDDLSFHAYMDQNFDVDGFLRYQAMAMLLGMPDDYWAMGNNYYLYLEDGMTRFIPYDYDHVLGSGWGGEPGWSYAGISDADIFKWRNLNNLLTGQAYAHPLVDRLLEVASYRDLYISYLEAYTDPAHGLFSYEGFESFFEAMEDLYGDIRPQVGTDWPMTITPGTPWYFERKLASIKNQLEEVGRVSP